MKNIDQGSLFSSGEIGKEVAKEKTRTQKKKPTRNNPKEALEETKKVDVAEDMKAQAEEIARYCETAVAPHVANYKKMPYLCVHGQKKHQCFGSCFK